jgi:hypothetical protein
LRSTLWSTANRSPAMAGSSRRSRTCATVRPAGSDLERPSTITVTEASRRSSPSSATATSAAVSHSSSHARRVGRSLVGEGKGVRGGHGERRRVDGPGSSSWAPAATTAMRARSDQYLTTISSSLLANCTAFAPAYCLRWRLRAPRIPVTAYLQTTTARTLCRAGRCAAARDDPMVDTSPPIELACHLVWPSSLPGQVE